MGITKWLIALAKVYDKAIERGHAHELFVAFVLACGVFFYWQHFDLDSEWKKDAAFWVGIGSVVVGLGYLIYITYKRHK